MRMSWVGWRPLAAVLAAAGLFSVGSARLLAADRSEVLKALEGTWTGTRWDEGKGDDPAKGVKLRLIFKGDKVTGQRDPSGEIGEGTFEISKDGTQIDALGKTGGYRAKSYLGIIKIEGDTLYWCTATGGKNQQRPEEFVADPGQHSYLIIVKRQKQ